MVSVAPHDAYGNKSGAAELEVGRPTHLNGPTGICLAGLLPEVAEGIYKTTAYQYQMDIFLYLKPLRSLK